ncbi:MAG: prepilin peptidase [Clostridia bacterium]|nr:prepilin peptidase [Clostridia bacterium]
MYINDLHILRYFFIGVLGLFVGQFLDWANVRLENHEKILCKEFFTSYLRHIKINAKLIYPMALIYIGLLYNFGWTWEFLQYAILAPMFVSVFIIDYRKQIIPNRLSLSIFEIGLIFTFAFGISNFDFFINRVLGLCVGGGIFLLITLIGGLIAGKEAMGFGDVKLMAGLGLVFGWLNTIMISVSSFLLGSIISIALLVMRKKKGSEYIPFGPFIILATFLLIFVPDNIMLTVLLKIFTLGMYQG